jgi:ABC-type nitrate/sulfonate/bicarbonate transport system permease component
MSASRLAQAAIQPWAVALQVTPLPAIAPLIIIWVGEPFAALVVCATIIAFFPLFANTATGLASPPPELADLFRLYGASRWRTMTLLRLPAALPYFLSGLRISGGLALSAPWWRNWSPAPAVSPPAWHTASWKQASGWRCHACSPPWCYSRSLGS